LAGGFEEMDDEDYSWVRRTRFSQSIVRSSSGREQYGAFIEQFSRGAELRQNGLGTGYKHPRQKGVVGLNLDIPQRHVVRPSKESPDVLDFSFHSDEHSQRLQRVCSSPAPFFMKDATATADSCHSLFQLG